MEYDVVVKIKIHAESSGLATAKALNGFTAIGFPYSASIEAETDYNGVRTDICQNCLTTISRKKERPEEQLRQLVAGLMNWGYTNANLTVVDGRLERS